MKRIILKNRRLIALLMVFVMLLATGVGYTIIEAEDDNLLTKDVYIEDMINYSNAIESITDARNDLATTLSDLSASTSQLKSVHEQLPAYRTLGVIYDREAGQEGHIDYLNLLIAGGSNLQEPELTAFNTLAATVASAVVMTEDQYRNYLMLQGLFQGFGISSHKVSKELEYNTFVSVIYVTPLALQQSLASLNRQVEALPQTLESTASSLYNTVVMMEDVLILLDASYESAYQEFLRSSAKYDKGLISDYDFNIITNNVEASRISRDAMERNIDNMKMQLNVLRGVSPKEDFSVEPYRERVISLKDLDYYQEQALLNSDTIKDKEDAIYYQERKFSYIEDYFSASSDEYKVEKLQLDLYELELQEALSELQVTVINEYNDLVLKQEEYVIARRDTDDAGKQLADMSIRAQEGYVADYVVSDMNALVTAMINAENTALREYIEALEGLYTTSGLDFPYDEGDKNEE